MLSRSQAAVTKPTSKSALCAQRGRFPQNLRKSGRISPIFGAPRSIASVMPVRSMILPGSARSGSTKVWKVSSTSPRFMTTAPISMIASCCEDRPVVSRSNATYSSSKPASFGPWTTMRSSTSFT